MLLRLKDYFKFIGIVNVFNFIVFFLLVFKFVWEYKVVIFVFILIIGRVNLVIGFIKKLVLLFFLKVFFEKFNFEIFKLFFILKCNWVWVGVVIIKYIVIINILIIFFMFVYF